MTKSKDNIYVFGDGVRNRLREIAHEVYDRLVMEEHVEANNRAENVLTVLVYSLIGLISGGLVFFATTVGSGALSQVGVRGLDPLLASVVGGFAAVVISLFVFGGQVSDFGLRYVGRTTIYSWRRLPGAKNRERRNEMLDTIEEWLRSNPGKPAHEVRQRYGRGVGQVLPGRLLGALSKIKRRKDDLDWVLLRGVMERRYKSVYGARYFRSVRPHEKPGNAPRDYYTEARELRNALKINLIMHHLGADLRDEIPDGEKWRRDYVTHPQTQQLTLWDERDLPTRFRTFSPHLRWPKHSEKEIAEAGGTASSVGEAPYFVAIAGVENPLRLPLHLIGVDDVIAAMPAATLRVYDTVRAGRTSQQAATDSAIEVLLTKPVPMFAKKDPSTLRALGGVDAPEIPILRRTPDDVLEMRWDPNRILWESMDTASNADLRQALALVLAAIDICINGDPESRAAPSAQAIELGRGDLLILDNQRMMVCRRESDFHEMQRRGKLAAGMPPQWWLRGYYGFRTGSEERRSKGSGRKHVD